MTTLEISEKLNNMDLRAMSYNESLGLYVATIYVSGMLKHLMPAKRTESMSAFTREYYAKKEALDCEYSAKKEALEREYSAKKEALESEEESKNEALLNGFNMVMEGHLATEEEVEILLQKRGELGDIIFSEPDILAQPACDMNMADNQEPEVENGAVSQEQEGGNYLPEAPAALPEPTPSKTKRHTDVEKAIEVVEGLPVADGTDVSFSYYVSYELKKSNGEYIHTGKIQGWNMNGAALEKLKIAEKKHMESHYKNSTTTEVGDYVVYLLYAGRCIVSCFSKNKDPEFDLDDSKMPKEVSEEQELVSFIENLPSDEPVCSAGDSTQEKTVPVNATPVPASTNPVVKKAVELTKSLLPDFSDVKAPYFIQADCCVGNDGSVVLDGNPFCTDMTPDAVESTKKRHIKYAMTMKADDVETTDGYTAVTWKGGNHITVYYYNHINK